MFLSRIHCNTSAADLETGALALKIDYKSRTEQRKQLVKDHFNCFVSCKTTIDDIESKLRRIEDEPEGSGTSHLFNIIQGVSSQANYAFKPLFECQAQAEKIRTVQGMLQRFRTLFNLPSTIRGNISKGEYDLAVREYKKAKSIIQVGILKRVLEEVEKVMNEFKRTIEFMVLPTYFMSDAIEDISKACAALEMKEAAPPVAVAALRTLQPEIIRIIVSILERNKSPNQSLTCL
ncbi:exocyst complex component sec5 [Medicago truncatula]|uniref:Exocyst complex component SEC5 n=1 Tax=Medicago truncatula TaxID=3880 RepID=G7IVK4_MEDTR|nr:exocyst complex component sec5 [Medicago truncatula]